MAFTPLNLKSDVAARAKELAKARGCTMAAVVGDLIDATYRAEIGPLSRCRAVDGTDRIAVTIYTEHGDREFQIPHHAAATVADRLLAHAGPNRASRAVIDLDLDCTLMVARRGMGVTLQAFDATGDTIKQSMSCTDARRLAKEIKAFI